MNLLPKVVQYFIVLSTILCIIPLKAQTEQNSKDRFTISGYIEDASTGEKLIGATVFDIKSGQGTVTNVYGFYSLTLPSDSIYLSLSFMGMEQEFYKLFLSENISLDFALKEEATALEAVEVIAEEHAESIEDRVQMSQISIPIEQIKKLPAFLGEVDVLKTLQLLPGVQSGSEGSSGFYVRGGSPDQNLILLDGVPVYNASHLFGFFSVFNADAIKSVSLTKGGYPARYGGRLSSVLEINMKEGNMKGFHGEGSIGLISSKFTFEGPILKNKASFIISARRTYIDLLAKPFIILSQRGQAPSGGSSSNIPGYYFYDLNAKVNYKFNRKHRLYASFYLGDDKFNFNSRDQSVDNDITYIDEFNNKLQWGNITSAVRWNYLINNKLFLNTTATYSRYNFSIGILDKTTEITPDSTTVSSFGAKYFSGIEDLALKFDFDYVPKPNHYIRFGANAIYHQFKPGAINLQNVDEIDNINLNINYGNTQVNATELATYIEDDWEITNKFRANIGVHASAFLVNKEFYYSVQPRLGLRYLLPRNYALKASFATMTQYIHLLSNEGLGLPTDLWLPSTENVTPEQSWQAAIGAAKTFEGLFELSAEVFYRNMRGLISYKPGASFIDPGSNWQDKVEIDGLGNSYGLEVFLQRNSGKFTGWFGYTLAWSNRHFPDTEINSGNPYPFKYDRRHDISLTGMYEFNKKVSVSAIWVFGSGNTVTLPIERVGVVRSWGVEEIEGYGSKNDYRLAAYHRLDLSVDLHYYKKKWEHHWSFGLYNAYSRQNPFFIYADEDWETNLPIFRQVSLFPIIPSVRWNFKF